MDAVFLRKFLDKRRAQGQHPGRRRVVGLVLHQGLNGCEFDVGRRLKEWLAAVQGVHLKAARSQLHHLVADLHDIGESNLVQPLCQPDPALLDWHD